MSRRVLVEMTELEAAMVVRAVGAAIYYGNDESTFVKKVDRNAVWRGHNKIRDALAKVRGMTEGDDAEVR